MQNIDKVIIAEDDISATSNITFCATDVAEQWLLSSKLETELVIPNPSTEAWLFKNPEALGAVRRGLADAAEGRVSKVDIEEL
jgi:hypothetical protein